MLEEPYAADLRAVQQIDFVPEMLDTLCRLTGMGFAAVARVTSDRWIACAVRDDINFGLPVGGELAVESTICHEVRQANELIVFDDADVDPAFANHHAPRIYGLKSYISVPIVTSEGAFFGTLCAIHPAPAPASRAEIVSTFRMFARLIGYHLEVADRLVASEALRLEATAAAELREQFIAVLGHDLRNPLTSIASGLTLLDQPQNADRVVLIRKMMGQSIARMSGLIADILDFARGRLGQGITLQKRPTEMKPLIEQIVGEIAASNPDRDIRLECDTSPKLSCDPGRIAQLLSNLLGNAVSHGASDQPIRVHCQCGPSSMTVSVTNGGPMIPESAMAMLFQPFKRGVASTRREGLGLGLFIAQEIARAHGGEITVLSDESATTFSLSLPLP